MAKFYYSKYNLSWGDLSKNPWGGYEQYNTGNWRYIVNIDGSLDGPISSGSVDPWTVTLIDADGSFLKQYPNRVEEVVTVDVIMGDTWYVLNHTMRFIDLLNKRTKGTFVEKIIAEDGTYPDNGIKDGFWYEKGKALMPTIKLKQNGQIVQMTTAKISGKNISKIYVKDQNGNIRNVK